MGFYSLSRPERYRQAMKKQRRIVEISDEHNLSPSDMVLLRNAVADDLGTDLQSLMFLPNIKSTFSEEQQKYWLPRALSWEVVGCYAQTELGHGSNVRALETTATFVHQHDSFEINTPSLTATKWWPGNLGKSSNHAIVYARLIIDEKDYGIHNFMVQIRDFDTHQPMKGISIGDIGPKIGYNNQDNGFLKFNRVMIPRKNMAMKHAYVDENGLYSSRSSAKRKQASYSSMTYVRASIVVDSGQALSMGVTISTRYSAIRKQGFKSNSKEEMTVLDYTMQQARILPFLATAYALKITGSSMLNMMTKGNDVEALHIASSGLKALCSRITADGIEACRKACGGHGYLLASGLPELYGTYLQTVTVEGENYMIAQQTTKGLMKKLLGNRSAAGRDTSYVLNAEKISGQRIQDFCIDDNEDSIFFDPNIQVAAYQQRASFSLLYLKKKLDDAARKGVDEKSAWDAFCPDVIRVSESHCFFVLVKNFTDCIDILKSKNSPIAPVLSDLCDLFCCWNLQLSIHEFLESGFLKISHVDAVRRCFYKKLKDVRKNAVALCDAWGHTDHRLHSCLGRYDGNVYQALFESAQADMNPMNRDVVDRAFHDSLQPMRRKVSRL
eukprot:g3797.t1